MSKKTKKRPMRQRIRQEANYIGRDFAIGILVLCFLTLFMSCSRSTATFKRQAVLFKAVAIERL
jgi:hypothetical protein